MTANQTEYPVQLMSRTLGVSRSGYYAHLEREPCARSVADAELTKRIEAIHSTSKETYGAQRIHAELSDEGVSIGRKRVERLDLPRFRSAPGAHLSGDPFECQGAFPA